MEVLGYFLAILIGVLLGLIGGGGSILSVPVLVYVMGVNPVLATAYSLFIVGTSSLVGAINNFKKSLVSVKTAIVFAIPSFIAVYLTRLYIVPAIPNPILKIGEYSIGKESGLMLFFALIMLLAAFSMMRPKKERAEIECKPQFNYPMIALEGLVVGIITGIVGAGGGFLIIPALVLFAKLPMKLAVGTSLTIVTVKSLIGFLGDLNAGQLIDWPFLLLFTALSIVGIFIGTYLTDYISGAKLKKGFAWFVLIMAVLIFIKEIM